MLDKYKQTQPIVYNILKNAITKNEYSHAYLFETHGFSDSYNLVISFIKEIICPQKNNDKKDCGNCKICNTIDSGNFPEIKIINPDGLWIKKGQLQELQAEFKKKAIIGTKKIYIINEAEKLNKEAANSILKFLEEPEEGIIAILITNNIYQILETIRSRCQIIKLKEQKINFDNETTIQRLLAILNDSKNQIEKENIEKAINFVNYYEKHHLDTIIYMEKLWHSSIKNKQEILYCFDVMIMYYKDILNYLINNNIEIFIDYIDEIKTIGQINNIQNISKKLNILTTIKEKNKYNVNTNLLMDKLIILLEGGI